MNRLRDLRRAAGLSQAELARAAGISRQLIGAIEAGRHAPGVDAALALASSLHTTVEHLFGTPRAVASVFGEPPDEGAPVAAARVGSVVYAAPLSERGAGPERWQRADGIWKGGRAKMFADADGLGLLVAGCDPALGLAATLLPERGPRRLAVAQASSGRALQALEAGHLHGALVHGPKEASQLAGRAATGVTLGEWEVGLAFRPGLAAGLDEIAAGRIEVAQREPGAGAQRALERALGAGAAPRGPIAGGHLDAARRVAYGAVDAAVTMRSAALVYGLDFVPLEEHVAELLIASPHLDHPGVAALGEVINSKEFRDRLAAVGGYDVTETGATRRYITARAGSGSSGEK